jgi:hypothetical protein
MVDQPFAANASTSGWLRSWFQVSPSAFQRPANDDRRGNGGVDKTVVAGC